ncbi:hypothetical protein ACJ73_00237 [Blastomyces percursus]|uniref:Phosphosulfolactate synthase n=1 Tax=Blastomyces percursus TaxID=1658174 RepID=A0A1J9QHP1_9EURO|nr:hypothetical protein ACJ73_00237 [Blastomyces percursus]
MFPITRSGAPLPCNTLSRLAVPAQSIPRTTAPRPLFYGVRSDRNNNGITRNFSASAIAKKESKAKTLLQDKQHGLGFARSNPIPAKPRKRGVTEIRGPYYSVMGKRYLADVLETMGHYVDGLKFSGGSFSLFEEKKLKELIDLAHQHDVYVSTGGWAEHLLTHHDAPSVMEKYLQKCKNLGFVLKNIHSKINYRAIRPCQFGAGDLTLFMNRFDVVEISSGFLSIPADDWLRLVDKVHSYGLKAKPELGIQFGAGGDTSAAELEAFGTDDPGKLINLGRRFLDAGVERLMIESEGITENVRSWRTDVASQIMKELPPEQVMFEGIQSQNPGLFP